MYFFYCSSLYNWHMIIYVSPSSLLISFGKAIVFFTKVYRCFGLILLFSLFDKIFLFKWLFFSLGFFILNLILNYFCLAFILKAIVLIHEDLSLIWTFTLGVCFIRFFILDFVNGFFISESLLSFIYSFQVTFFCLIVFQLFFMFDFHHSLNFNPKFVNL